MNFHDEVNHISDAPFDAYEGPPPYIFVCYSHKDASLVFSDLEKFHNLGVNIFYDEGLPSGLLWAASIEEKIKNSTLFVPFISQNTVESKPSLKEIDLASRSNIPILPIFLEEVSLKYGLDYLIGGEQAIFRYLMNDERYAHYYIREFKRHGFDIDGKDDSGLSDLPTYYEKESLLSESLSNLLECAKNRYFCEKTSYAHSTSPIEAKRSSGRLGWISRIFKGSGAEDKQTTHSIEQPSEVSNSCGNHVFISYSAKDQGMAMEICSYLEDKGVECWIAPRNIAAGGNYSDEIMNGLKKSQSVVVVSSKNAYDSSYVANEIDYAFSLGKPIISFRIDDYLPEGPMEFYLKGATWIDANPCR